MNNEYSTSNGRIERCDDSNLSLYYDEVNFPLIVMRMDSEAATKRNMNFVATALAMRDWILTAYFNSGIHSNSFRCL